MTSVVGSFPVFMFIVRSSLCKVWFGTSTVTLHFFICDLRCAYIIRKVSAAFLFHHAKECVRSRIGHDPVKFSGVLLGVEATTLPLVQYIGVTIGIFLVSYAISMVEADLSVVLGFVGSTVGICPNLYRYIAVLLSL